MDQWGFESLLPCKKKGFKFRKIFLYNFFNFICKSYVRKEQKMEPLTEQEEALLRVIFYDSELNGTIANLKAAWGEEDSFYGIWNSIKDKLIREEK